MKLIRRFRIDRELSRQFINKSSNDLLFPQAKALAYTSLLSLVPLLAVAFVLFKAFGGFQALQEKLQPYITENLAPAFGEQIWSILNGIESKVSGGALGAFGFLGFIYTSISTLSTIEDTFNRIWGVQVRRAVSRRFTTYWCLLTLGPVLFGTSLALSTKADTWLRADHGEISRVLLFMMNLTPYFLTGCLFSILYFILPNATVAWQDALKAGLGAGAVFEIAKRIYSIYAAHALGQGSVYGSMAILPLFFIWIYLAWLIVLFGAEFCCYLQYRRAKVPFRFHYEGNIQPLVISDMLEYFVRNGGTGAPKPISYSGLLNSVQLPVPDMNAHLRFLEKNGWIVAAREGKLRGKQYYLTCAAAELNMKVILEQLDSITYAPKGQVSRAVEQKLKQIWHAWSHQA